MSSDLLLEFSILPFTLKQCQAAVAKKQVGHSIPFHTDGRENGAVNSDAAFCASAASSSRRSLP
jgi:hypothetical protein